MYILFCKKLNGNVSLNLQANNQNKRWLKDSLSGIKPENIANFTSALITGFEILAKVISNLYNQKF